jgi:hypothetical protein
VISQLLIPVATVFGLLGGEVAPVPTVVAQVAGQAGEAGEAREATSRALRRVSELERALVTRRAERDRLQRVHRSQLAEVDALSRQRASWNRDRRLRSKRAEAHATGERLQRIEAELRTLSGNVDRARHALRRAIDAELATGVSAARRVVLEQTLERLAAALRPKPRPIRVPDLEIDRLADPEELIEQARLIRQTEQRLLREQRLLAQRESRYRREVALRAKRQRDVELGAMDGDDVRRVGPRFSDPASAGRDGAGAQGDFADADAEPGAPPPGESDPSPGAGSGGSDFGAFTESSVVLADVVEPGTLDALRRAASAGDARSRASAAGRAKKDVEAQLRLLRERREAIERRARELRRR